MKGFDKVAEETTRTTIRMDAMEGNVNRFTGALKAFLGRIHIDERLRLVPDRMLLSPGPPLPTTRSASPVTPGELPMEVDDSDIGGEGSSPAGTRTTPSDLPEERMEGGPIELDPIPTASGPDPTSNPPRVLSPIGAPTLAVTPAVTTPHTMTEDPLPLPAPVVRGRSRTPANVLLGVEDRTTHARSRSKTPI
jgi:hypothetical protein